MEIDTNIFRIQPHQDVPERGKILVSEPFGDDSFFKRTVVLLTEHNQDGSVGFVLNKPIHMPIESIVRGFPHMQAKVSLGGPVQQESLYYLHTLGSKLPNSLVVKEGLYWGGSFDILKMLIDSGEVADYQVRFFIGYSGWQPQQLQAEIDRNFWLIGDLANDYIMRMNSRDVWKGAIRALPTDYRPWINFPDNPAFN